jgi:hypothetical protein
MSELAENILVQCPCCHRSERWKGAARYIELEGGQRQPVGHPHLAAWNTLKRSLSGEIGRVVGACSACGQPLVTAQSVANIFSWTFTTTSGDYHVASDVQGPDGHVTLDDFHQKIVAEYYEEEVFEPAQTLFNMTVLGFMTVPIILWVLTGISVALILFNYSASTPVFVPSF